jgi:AraC-like DNA-binding protein
VLLSRALIRSLTRARARLEADDDATSVADIARAVGMSPFHFIRRFESVYGVTPHQLRIRARLDRAKHLLAHDHSVTAVCFDVGFSSLGSFSSAFARRIGETPSSYQRRARRLVQVPATYGHALYPGCFALMAKLPAAAFAISKKR